MLKHAEVLQRKITNLHQNPNWCILCHNSSEDLDHIFISCSFTKVLWAKVERLILWKSQHQDVSSLCSEMCMMNQKRKKGIIKFNTLSGVLWDIWLERNNRIFKGKKSSTINIWEDICALLGFCATKSSLFSNYNASSITLNI